MQQEVGEFELVGCDLVVRIDLDDEKSSGEELQVLLLPLHRVAEVDGDLDGVSLWCGQPLRANGEDVGDTGQGDGDGVQIHADDVRGDAGQGLAR